MEDFLSFWSVLCKWSKSKFLSGIYTQVMYDILFVTLVRLKKIVKSEAAILDG